MAHKNKDTNYRKIKIGDLIMSNNCSSKQWVGRCHMDLLIKIEIGSPFEKTLLYSIQNNGFAHQSITYIQSSKPPCNLLETKLGS